MNKNAHKCLKVLARALTFLLLIVFLTIGMNSTEKGTQKGKIQNPKYSKDVEM